MKILVVSDNESKYIWDYFNPESFKDVNLIISCGDLKASYLSFLATLINAPMLYVHGNHDSGYIDNPPGGCESIEDRIVMINGIRILGLGGSHHYNDGPFQYTESQMSKRIKKLKRTIKKYDGFDILLSHAPAFGVGDGKDLCHRGFKAFNDLINTYKPSYFIHGHQHLNYGGNAKRIQKVDETTIINGYEYYMFDYKPNIYAPLTPVQIKENPIKRIFHLFRI